MSRDCPEPKVFRCRNCDDEGHQARDCTKPKDWSRVKCRNCETYGHGAGRCTNPPVETSGGEWGNGGGDSGATGGWADGGGGLDDAPKSSTADWADEATAAANGDSSGSGDAPTK
jgi:cellular nucleic acid-binding protein